MEIKTGVEYNETVPTAELQRREQELTASGWTIVARFGLDYAAVPRVGGSMYTGPATRLVYTMAAS